MSTVRIRKAPGGTEQQVGGPDNGASAPRILVLASYHTPRRVKRDPSCQRRRAGENTLARPHSPRRLGGTACTHRLQRGLKNHDREQNADGGAAFPPDGTIFLNPARMEALETLRRPPSVSILQSPLRSVVERLARACGDVLVTSGAAVGDRTLVHAADRGLA